MNISQKMIFFHHHNLKVVDGENKLEETFVCFAVVLFGYNLSPSSYLGVSQHLLLPLSQSFFYEQSDGRRGVSQMRRHQKSVGTFPLYSCAGALAFSHTTSIFYAVCMKHSFTVETKEIQETGENILEQKKAQFLVSYRGF